VAGGELHAWPAAFSLPPASHLHTSPPLPSMARACDTHNNAMPSRPISLNKNTPAHLFFSLLPPDNRKKKKINQITAQPTCLQLSLIHI
jgi:hypothetical protein